MKTGDVSAQVPPVIPARQGEVSGFVERKPALRWLGLGIFLLGMAACWVLYRFNPSLYHFYPRCMFNAVTGLLCPGCGSQRALYQLIHGHVLVACRCNLLLMAGLAWLSVQVVRRAMAEWRGTPAPRWLPHPRWYKWLAAAMILFAILRNFSGAPFCYLAPP